MRRSASADDLAARLAVLRARRDPAAAARCDAVRTLVVVCSSSRGGSSVFGELLRRCAGLLHFSAEINPHVVIATLGAGTPTPDVIADPAPHAGTEPGLSILRAELALDAGRPATVPTAAFAAHVAWRLTMQWPAERIDPDDVDRWVAETLDAHGFEDRDRFLVRLLERVRSRHPGVHLSAYDLDPTLLPAADRRYRPTEPVVEMAPFIVPRPWAPADADELAAVPLVTTTPRNAFRLPLLQAAFPDARVRVVHLVRNPAAAVNGLLDGWLHPAFASVRVPGGLRIDGYTGVHPDGGAWWSFDVPPAWRSWTHRPLVDVCAFQWRAAHEATMRAVERLGLDYHRIAFEDLVGPRAQREAALVGLATWLGVDDEDAARLRAPDLPVVMATAPPRPGRWRDRAEVLAPVLADATTVDLAVRLGYEPVPATWR